MRVLLSWCMIGLYLDITMASYDDVYDTSHVREWTVWYNTDKPTPGGGDDESVSNIRKRGIEICNGNIPIDAICRVSNHHGISFNAGTVKLTDDLLYNPCTYTGIQCRNMDQMANITCRDYEIRFECLNPKEDPNTENIAVVAVAAALSIITPVICVILMHIVRMVKERRAHNRRLLGDNNSETGSQAENNTSDLPPTYSELFGENITESTENLLGNSSHRLVINNASGNDVINLPNTRVPSSNRANESSIYSIRDDRSVLSPISVPTSPNDSCSSSQRFRFPGMHLSIHDLMTSHSIPMMSQSDSPQISPSLSYSQTPPPTYADAIVILGGFPYKHQPSEHSKLQLEAQPEVENSPHVCDKGSELNQSEQCDLELGDPGY